MAQEQATDSKNNGLAITQVGKWIASIRYPEIRVILDEWCKYLDTFHEVCVAYRGKSKAQFEKEVKEKQNGNGLSDAQRGAIVKLYAFLEQYEQERQQSQSNGM